MYGNNAFAYVQVWHLCLAIGYMQNFFPTIIVMPLGAVILGVFTSSSCGRDASALNSVFMMLGQFMCVVNELLFSFG